MPGTTHTVADRDAPRRRRRYRRAIEGWLKEVDAIEKAKADAVRNNPTKANAQAAAEAQKPP